MVLINEFEPNPTGADGLTQTIELKGIPGTSFEGCIVTVESDNDDPIVDRATVVSGSFDANGLLTVEVADLENPSFIMLLVEGPCPPVGVSPVGLLDATNVLDAIGIPDSVVDEERSAPSRIDPTLSIFPTFRHTGDEPRLVFRDSTTNAWYAINDPDNGEVYDIDGIEVSGSVSFSSDPLADTLGDVNPASDGLPPPPTTNVVINEIDADQTGTDNAEFVELYDGGVGNTSLDGLVLVLFNGSGDSSYDAIDLDGLSTDADGYFVIGSGNVPNVDLVAFTTNGIQNGADAVALYVGSATDFPNGTAPTTANLLDAIAYDTNDADDAGLLAGLGLSTQVNEDANNLKDTQSISRVPDGDAAIVVQAPTPGETNVLPPPPAPFSRKIHEVQGSGDVSALVGDEVTVEAIVVGDFQNGDGDNLRNLGGFFLQEEDSDQDADTATSEGIFIFDGSLAAFTDVSIGDRVQVTGTVSEFFGETQITASSISVIAEGAVADVNSLATLVTLDGIEDSDGDNLPDLEAYEGMLARFTDTLVVNEMFQLDRFNEVRLSVDDRPAQFTQLFDPDPAAFAAYQSATGSDQIIFDDGLGVQNAPIFPEADLNGDGVFDTDDGFSMGDSITGLTGVVNFAFNEWRVRSVDSGNTFVDADTRDETPPDVEGTLTVASFNVLNFFTTLDVDGNPGSGPGGLDPRGADNIAEFERQTDKLVTALAAMDADIFGLVELENEFGTDQNGDGLVAISFLVDELNAKIGSVTYAAVDPGRGFVDVQDAISVGMIYKMDSVSVVAGSVEILDDSDLADLPSSYTGSLFDGVSTNRAPLAATFEDLSTGEDFTVAVAHMKSKGGTGTGPDADAGDGAGNFNDLRTQGVQALNEWLATFADEDQLVLGDFNAYLKEDPIDQMLADGYTDLAEVFDPGADSYVFDGKTGTLDYAFGSAGLMDNVTGAAVWQINSEEPDAIDYNTDFGRDPAIFDGSVPFRSSDHDPILVGLAFESPLNLVDGTTGRDYLLGTAGDDLFRFKGGIGDAARGLGGDDQFDLGDNATNGLRDNTRIFDWSDGDLIVGIDFDDINLASVRESGTAIRFAYGDDNDVLTVTGDVSGGVESLFGPDLLV